MCHGNQKLGCCIWSTMVPFWLGEQLRQIAVYTCVHHVSPRCPADHLWWDLFTACQIALCTVITTVIAPLFVFNIGNMSPNKPSCPVLMIYYPVMPLFWTHQITFAFAQQSKCGQMCPRPPRLVVWVIRSQCVMVVTYTLSTCDPADHKWTEQTGSIFLG